MTYLLLAFLLWASCWLVILGAGYLLVLAIAWAIRRLYFGHRLLKMCGGDVQTARNCIEEMNAWNEALIDRALRSAGR